MSEAPTNTVKCEIDVPLERIVNCIIGAVEGGSNYWLNEMHCLPASRDIRADLMARDLIWYAEEEFWTRGGGATFKFDKPTADSTGTANVGMTQLRNGLNIMAQKAPRHFSDLIRENDDAETHDVFIQMVLFGEIIYG